MVGLIFMICLLFILAAVGFAFAWLVHKISKPNLPQGTAEPVMVTKPIQDAIHRDGSQ